MWRDGAIIAIGLLAPVAAVAGVYVLLRACAAPIDRLLDLVPGKRLRSTVTAYLMLAPALLILGVFGIAPLVYAVIISLYDSRRGVGPYVRFGNYERAFHDAEFWNSVEITVTYALATVPLTLILSFIIADALFHIGRARGLFRTAYFLPYVTSTVAAAMVWRLFFQPRYGLANKLLAFAGIEPNAWLLEPRGILYHLSDGRIPADVGPSMALVCVILFDIWHSSGFMIVILLAAFTAIPRELDDASRIDGARWFQRTRHVIIPMLSPTLFFLLVVGLIRAFQAFNSFYALTGNGRGPGNSTQSLTVYVYSAFEHGRWGYGSAVATILALAIIVLTLVQWRVLGRKVHYE